MKFNKKGQGALEYLLLIGGAVLIAVIVIALLISMGSRNAEKAAEQSEGALDKVLPPIINSVTCTSEDNAIIAWTPIAPKNNHVYKVTEDGIVVTPEGVNSDTNLFDSSVNPIALDTGDCNSGRVYAITVKDNDTNATATSNIYAVK